MVTENPSSRLAPSGTTLDLQSLDGQNVLVSGSPLSGKSAFVVDRLAAAEEALLVTATRSAGRQLGDVDGVFPVVDCTPGESDCATNVGTPGDLTGISMPVSRFLDSAPEPVLGVDSVSSLLMYAGEAPVFRFLSVLTGQVRRANGVGLFTLEEGCQEPTTANTLAQLFDGRLEFSEDGTEARVVGFEQAPEWVPV